MANAINSIWAAAPVLDISKTMVGPTDYIDRIPAKYMAEKVMKGIDPHGRKFLALRCEAETVDYGYGSENVPFVVVAFERYADAPDFWVVCGDFCRCGALDEEKLGFIKNLIDGKVIDLENDFSCSIELK